MHSAHKLTLWLSCFVVAALSVSPLTPSVHAEASSPSSKNFSVQQVGEWGMGEAVSLSYSVDGSLLAVGTVAGYVLIYDTSDFHLVQTIQTDMTLGFYSPGFSNSYAARGSLALSPDNQWVGVIAVDESVGVWNIQDGQSKFIHWGTEHGKYKSEQYVGWAKYGYFQGRGEIFVVRSEYFGFRFFRTEDGAELSIGSLPLNTNYEPATAPDLRFLVGTPGIDRSTNLLRWLHKRTLDWLQWTDVRKVWEDTWVRGGYSPDGFFAVRRSSDIAAVWDIRGTAELFRMQQPAHWQNYSAKPEYVWSLTPVFSQNDQTVAFFWPYHFGEMYLASIWSIPQKKEIGSFAIPAPPSSVTAISPSGNQMAYPVPAGVEIVGLPAGGITKTIIWGTCAGTLKLSPNGKLIASYFAQYIYICDAQDGKMLRSIRVPTGAVTDIDWSPDSLNLVSSGNHGRSLLPTVPSYDSQVHVWNVETAQEVKSFINHNGDVEQVRYSPDGSTIVTNGYREKDSFRNCQFASEGEILLQQASDDRVVSRMAPLQGLATQIDFTPDGTHLVILSIRASCFQNPIIYFVDLRGHATKIADANRFIVMPNGNILTYAVWVSNTAEAKVQQWDIDSVQPQLLNTVDLGSVDTYNAVEVLASAPDSKGLIIEHLMSGPNGQSGERDIYLKSDPGSSTQTLLLQDKGNSWLPDASVIFSKDNSLVLISAGELPGVIKVFKITP